MSDQKACYAMPASRQDPEGSDSDEAARKRVGGLCNRPLNGCGEALFNSRWKAFKEKSSGQVP